MTQAPTFLQRAFRPQPPGGDAVRPGRRLHPLRARQPGPGLRADALQVQAHLRELGPHAVAGVDNFSLTQRVRIQVEFMSKCLRQLIKFFLTRE